MKGRFKRHQVPAKPPVWERMQTATLGAEVDAQMRAADPNLVGVFLNDLYQVTMREYPYDASGAKMSWLMIRRRDSEAVHDWRHLQRIKNDLCGPESEGIELYPAESRLVDGSNQYHLFVMPPGVKLPFGYMERDVSDASKLEAAAPGNKNKQRPFDEPPAGLNERVAPDQKISIYTAEDRTEPGDHVVLADEP